VLQVHWAIKLEPAGEAELAGHRAVTVLRRPPAQYALAAHVKQFTAVVLSALVFMKPALQAHALKLNCPLCDWLLLGQLVGEDML
jgi:hypothetical protein